MFDDPTKPHDRPALVHAVKTMPGWKWKLLGFGLIVGCLGFGGQMASHLLKQQPTHAVVTPSRQVPQHVKTPDGSSGFVGASPQSDTVDPAPAPAAPASPTLTDAITPFMSHFGFSLFVGLVTGLIFRTFLRMALMASALVVGGAMAITYFGHDSADLTAVKAGTSHAIDWATTQGYHLRDLAFARLPSSTAASVGFLFGFKRR